MQTYSQHSPFTDQANPPGQAGQPPGLPGSSPAPPPGSASQPAGGSTAEPTGAGSAAPTVPPDATMTSWRQPQMPRMLGSPPGAPPDAPGNLQGAILGKPSPGSEMPRGDTQSENGGLGPYANDWTPRNPDGSLMKPDYQQIPNAPPGATNGGFNPAPPSGAPPQLATQAPGIPIATPNLSDPAQWMSMVHDQRQRDAWVKEKLAAAGRDTPENETYYSKKVLGQPGANATEQAGSANYWEDLIRHPRQAQPKAISPLQTAIGGSSAPSEMLNATGNNNPLLTALRQQLAQRQAQ